MAVCAAPPNVTARSDAASMDESDVRRARWTLAIVTAWLPNALDNRICAAVPPMLVRTICRIVCWLKVVPLDWGDTAQVPVHAGAAARAAGAAVPKAGCHTPA